MNKKISFIVLFIVGIAYNYATVIDSLALDAKYPVIPTPQELTYGNSEVRFTSFSIPNTDFTTESNLLKSFFTANGLSESSKGLKINITKNKIPDTNSEEAYKLVIDKGISIVAPSGKGVFYAVQTIKQIFRKVDNEAMLPQLSITDWPAFKIRGLMHDTGRNFQSISQLKEQIDVLALYKYNVFHWHLTDNPGWRLESKIYPELQSDKATSRHKGKFYAQDDFKEIVDYCSERNITVIPEFDIPGHTDAFRRAFDLDRMDDKRVLPILLDLFGELLSLEDAQTLPYIHIGTDEVRNDYERLDNKTILEIMDLIKQHNREVIVWEEGIRIKEDTTSIGQLWAQFPPREGHRFIDSRANYVNHLDPFSGMTRLFFQQPARQKSGDEKALGGILCVWPDNNVADEEDILNQNPVYPAIVFYGDAIWHGKEQNHPEYWSNLPPVHSQEFKDFADFETKVITHRDLFFRDKPFPYVKQTDTKWKVIGPFDHKGNVDAIFPVEQAIKKSYTIDGDTYQWSEDMAGATLQFKHYFGFPAMTDKKSGTYYAYTNIYSPETKTQDFWVGFQGWSRSGGRRGGPFPNQGQWHTTNPKIWVNNKAIAPPEWEQPGLGVKTDEIPFIDEDYFYREPTKIALKKGWNKVLLKIPHGGNSWKWMFTCVPINMDAKGNVSEVSDIRYNPELRIYSDYYYKKEADFKSQPDTENEIIFLGNSITDGGDWNALFPEVNAINRGISGDVTDGILARIEEVTVSQPEKVFLLIGTNDLARGKSVDYVAKNIEKIVDTIKEQSPQTSIYVQSVLPVNPDVGKKFSGHKRNVQKILDLNTKLERITSEKSVNYINIHKPFSDKKGHLKAKFTHDGLHLNEKGYKRWKKVLMKLVLGTKN